MTDSTETPEIRVDHVGVAVHSVDEAEPFLELLGAEKLVHEADPTGAFRWAYYLLGDASRVELIEPVEGESSFLTEFLDENGPGMHHVTLEVADMDAAIATLEAEDVRVVDRSDYDEWSEAFVSPRNPTGALFQLMAYNDDYRERGSDEALFVRGEPLGDERENEDEN